MSSSLTARQVPTWMTVILGVLAVVVAVVAIVYFAEPAHQLPSFFPGHTKHGTRTRTKHGIAAAVVAGLLLLATWFSARKRSN